MHTKEGYVPINDVPIFVKTWGKWIEEPFGQDENELLLFITGNPGIPSYYSDFLKMTHEYLERFIPVWIVGHAGHDIPSDKEEYNKFPETMDNLEKFNLNGQIESKISFIRKYVPEHVKIYLVGHSVGTWMILQLLKNKDIKQRVKHCYCLFPTIERMMESPNGGNKMKFLFRHKAKILYFFTLVYALPTLIHKIILYTAFFIMGLPNSFLDSTLKLANRKTFENVIELTRDEMKTIVDVDQKLIEENVNILKFYYGKTDGWVPLQYCTDLKNKIPEVDAIIDGYNMDHIFASKPVAEYHMAKQLAGWISEDKKVKK